MSKSHWWSAVAVVGAFLSTGCGGGPQLACDSVGPTQVAILNGEYVSTRQGGDLTSRFPHVGGSDFELTVDRVAGLVDVRSEKDTTQVTERWRISGTTLQ